MTIYLKIPELDAINKIVEGLRAGHKIKSDMEGDYREAYEKGFLESAQNQLIQKWDEKVKNWGNLIGKIIESTFYAPDGKWSRFKNIDESSLQVPHSPNYYNIVIRIKMLDCRLAVLSGFVEDIEKATTTIIDESGMVTNVHEDKNHTPNTVILDPIPSTQPSTPVEETAAHLLNVIGQEDSLKKDTKETLSYLVKMIAIQSTRSSDLVDKRLVDNSLKLIQKIATTKQTTSEMGLFSASAIEFFQL